jgi:type IV pilus assembly protein PilV
MNTLRSSRGSTLIEVLVALLIACIGLLAMARLSAAAIGHQKSAQVRLTGITLAQHYAEHARLNVYGFDLGQYDIALTAAAMDAAVPADAKAASPDADEADDAVAANAVAAADRLDFERRVRVALPEGRVQVVARRSNTSPSRDLDVWLLWRDTALDDADSLAPAAVHQCPQGLSDTERAGASCMHFRVGL